ATYPGDMAVAMLALDAVVLTEGPSGGREIAIADFHRMPGDTPWRDNVLEPGELITAVRLPAPTGGVQVYRKVRDRASYAFALVSVAVDLTMEQGRIARCALAFGSLGTVPWRDRAVEQVLIGEAPSPALFAKAAEVLLEGAQGFGFNDFKIPLAARALAATLGEATRTGKA
ncbi:MAG: FAD binding domain-containing protein, partial [Novosphingobium sp.]|nr:FAD binding domain-containing protein [Novosphingobium sp.]